MAVKGDLQDYGSQKSSNYFNATAGYWKNQQPKLVNLVCKKWGCPTHSSDGSLSTSLYHRRSDRDFYCQVDTEFHLAWGVTPTCPAKTYLCRIDRVRAASGPPDGLFSADHALHQLLKGPSVVPSISCNSGEGLLHHTYLIRDLR